MRSLLPLLRLGISPLASCEDGPAGGQCLKGSADASHMRKSSEQLRNLAAKLHGFDQITVEYESQLRC